MNLRCRMDGRLNRGSTRVAIVTSSYVDRIEPGTIAVSDVWGRGTRELPADTVVLSMLRSSEDALFQALGAEAWT